MAKVELDASWNRSRSLEFVNLKLHCFIQASWKFGALWPMQLRIKYALNANYYNAICKDLKLASCRIAERLRKNNFSKAPNLLEIGFASRGLSKNLSEIGFARRILSQNLSKPLSNPYRTYFPKSYFKPIKNLFPNFPLKTILYEVRKSLTIT